ncbi:hypothetical protein BKA70DRAFT_411038 [Coprinopsis sp. MPI-PUGE-AT-0042]|nr:hypothetical protein BKA70DRAFT_411038 [Coprinopsis sp. MPI-PUGE-AT-0042]
MISGLGCSNHSDNNHDGLIDLKRSWRFAPHKAHISWYSPISNSQTLFTNHFVFPTFGDSFKCAIAECMRLQHPLVIHALFFSSVAATESLLSVHSSTASPPGSCDGSSQATASAGTTVSPLSSDLANQVCPCSLPTTTTPIVTSPLPPSPSHSPDITLDTGVESSRSLSSTASCLLPAEPAPSHSPDELLPQPISSQTTLSGGLDVLQGATGVLDQGNPSQRVVTSKVTAAILPHTTILGEVFVTEDLVVPSEASSVPQSTSPNTSLAGGASIYRRIDTTFILLEVVVSFSFTLCAT